MCLEKHITTSTVSRKHQPLEEKRKKFLTQLKVDRRKFVTKSHPKTEEMLGVLMLGGRGTIQ